MEDRVVIIGDDGRCMCSCADPCPLGKAGMQYRCTKEELEARGVKTVMEEKKPRVEDTWIWNPKVKGSGIIECIPQRSKCPVGCEDCFFQSGRSYLEPLEKNLPHIPSKGMAWGRVVRMNDGNDSNVERDLVEAVARQFKDYFFNTSIPADLERFSGPVVLTVNPGGMTNTDFHKLDKAPTNLMFVRVRTNMWNLEKVVDPVVKHYAVDLKVPVVITLMAYYTQTIPDYYGPCYEWKTRTSNPYWVLKRELVLDLESRYVDSPNVYLCGRHGSSVCSACGNCLREYYNAKERLRTIKETNPGA
jgi:hypothetical protein